MKRFARVVTFAALAFAQAGCGGHRPDGLASPQPSPASPVATAAAIDRDMIVILRDQRLDLPGLRGARTVRAAALATAQQPILAELNQLRAHAVRSFSLLNGFATKLSKGEAEHLATHPLVQAVVADATLRLPKLLVENAGGGASPAGTVTKGAASLCNTLEPEALALTNTAFGDRSLPQAQEVIDAAGMKVTGRGVKVAFLADGLDVTHPGFIRPDGTSVFVDYQDFSGDPAGTATDGAEAFGDASSIAAQDGSDDEPLTLDISQFVDSAHPLPSPCPVRVRGMAPGAELVGLKVFSGLGYTTTSSFVQAIEWAIVQDDVDVINESFAGNPFPDFADDPISLANAAAARAGVTVTVSSGDGGSAGTLGSPSTDPNTIAVGATTQYRAYAQTGYGILPLASGFVSDNVSAVSSGGFGQNVPRTVDIVAPGDLGWALCSTNETLFSGCGGFGGAPAPVQIFGGTSEAAPLTAGLAALVIQAYRSTHGSRSPTPALVKQIIMSTASDRGAPSDEQGAGRIDGLAAVRMALSVPDDLGGGVPGGTGVMVSPGSARITAEPGEAQSVTFQIRNTGTALQHLTPALETLGPPVAGETLPLQLAPATDLSFANAFGAARPYVAQTFEVPAGADHLDAAIAFPSRTAKGKQTWGFIGLLDPSGRQAAYSIPQGVGSGYGQVEVAKPPAGRWTAIVGTTPESLGDSYAGPVELTWSAERYVSIGSVSPPHLDLAPGAGALVTAALGGAAQPGDLAAALRLGSTAGGAATATVPIALRTLIPTGPHGGSFGCTLAGGNGRVGLGPTRTFSFDVPSAIDDLSVAIQLPGIGYSFVGFLVDPNGMALSSASNVDSDGNPQAALELFHASPQPGRWLFILKELVWSGKETSFLLTGRIAFNEASATASGLPTDPTTKLSASAGPVSASVIVTNTGAVAKAYFADARLWATTDVVLPSALCSTISFQPVAGACAFAYVPPQTSYVQFVSKAAIPLSMDAIWNIGGGPDLWARTVKSGAVEASVASAEVPYGVWVISPAPVGPFGAAGLPMDAAESTASGTIAAFDPTAVADSGDFWADAILGTSTYQPLVLAPGASGTIHLTLTPDPSQVGHRVLGSIDIDTYNSNDAYGSGDEVIRLPYAYTVAP
jgi:hypothetical protein